MLNIDFQSPRRRGRVRNNKLKVFPGFNRGNFEAFLRANKEIQFHPGDVFRCPGTAFVCSINKTHHLVGATMVFGPEGKYRTPVWFQRLLNKLMDRSVVSGRQILHIMLQPNKKQRIKCPQIREFLGLNKENLRANKAAA